MPRIKITAYAEVDDREEEDQLVQDLITDMGLLEVEVTNA